MPELAIAWGFRVMESGSNIAHSETYVSSVIFYRQYLQQNSIHLYLSLHPSFSLFSPLNGNHGLHFIKK